MNDGVRWNDVDVPDEEGADLKNKLDSTKTGELFDKLAGFRQGIELAESVLETRVQAFLQRKIGRCRDNGGDWNLKMTREALQSGVDNSPMQLLDRIVAVKGVSVYQYGGRYVEEGRHSGLADLLFSNGVSFQKGDEGVPSGCPWLSIFILVDELNAGLSETIDSQRGKVSAACEGCGDWED